MSLQNLYEKIRADKRVIDEYGNIKENEKTSKFAFATHDLSHINRVINNCEKLSKLLKLDGEKIAEIKIAALLHDIGCASGGKGGHAERSYIWVKKYFEDVTIKDNVRDSILLAIKQHSGIADDLVGKILAVADKVDICKERILPLGLLMEGNKEYSHLLSVDFDVREQSLIVQFTSNKKINMRAINDYYFTKKVFDVIHDLAKCLELTTIILIDDKNWEIK